MVLSPDLHYPSNAPIITSTEQYCFGDSLPETTYPSMTEFLAAYNTHAYDKGYAVVLADSKGLS